LQTWNLGYKTGLSFTNGDSWVTNGILGLLFTKYGNFTLSMLKNYFDIIKKYVYNIKTDSKQEAD